MITPVVHGENPMLPHGGKEQQLRFQLEAKRILLEQCRRLEGTRYGDAVLGALQVGAPRR